MLKFETESEPGAATERVLLLRRARVDRAWLQAERLATTLRRQGFIARVHFLDRLLQRARALGVRLDPGTLWRQFQRARHHRQTRPGYTNRIVVIAGMPIVYRMGGPRGRHVVLLSMLPRGQVPPVTPAQAPRLPRAREAESMSAFDDPEVRVVCEQARAVEQAVLAARLLLRPDRYRLRRDALNWLARTARRWARPGPGRPGGQGR